MAVGALIVGRAEGRRQTVDLDALRGALGLRLALGATRAAATARTAITALVLARFLAGGFRLGGHRLALTLAAARFAILTILALTLLTARLAFLAARLFGFGRLFGDLALVAAFLELVILEARAALLVLMRILILEPGAILVEDAEIMVRELEIIFGHDTVALSLGVTREIPIFLMQLGRVAARPVVDPVASIGAIAAGAPHLRAAAATATAVLPIVDQRFRVLVPGGPSHHSRRSRPAFVRALPGDSQAPSMICAPASGVWRSHAPFRVAAPHAERQAIGFGMGPQRSNTMFRC